MTTSVTRRTVFHNTTPDLQDQDRFLVSDRSCPKTDGLRPHHWLHEVRRMSDLMQPSTSCQTSENDFDDLF